MLLASFLLLWCLAQRALATTCYSHDKVSAADSPISNKTAGLLNACNAGHANSTCCFPYETCAPDLLCHSADGTVRRQYCTDSTWTTDQCSPLCPDYDQAGTILTTCQDGSYCCGLDNTDCCNNGSGTKINKKNGQIILGGQITKSVGPASPTTSVGSVTQITDGQAQGLSATGTTSSTSSSSSGASAVTAGPVTTNPTLPSPTAKSSSSGLSGGAKAGIAIGAIAGVALVAGLLFLLFRERRKRRALQSVGQGGGGYDQPGWQSGYQPPPQEMSAYEREEGKPHIRGELPDGQGKPQELHT